MLRLACVKTKLAWENDSERSNWKSRVIQCCCCWLICPPIHLIITQVVAFQSYWLWLDASTRSNGNGSNYRGSGLKRVLQCNKCRVKRQYTTLWTVSVKSMAIEREDRCIVRLYANWNTHWEVCGNPIDWHFISAHGVVLYNQLATHHDSNGQADLPVTHHSGYYAYTCHYSCIAILPFEIRARAHNN